MAETKEEKEMRRANEIVGDMGKISIAEDVIASLAGLAASEVKGLEEMRGSVAEGIVGIFGGGRRGVETEIGEESIRFSLKVAVQYGQPIHEVAQEIQSSVIKGVEEMTGLKISGVDVHVQELQFPEEAEETELTEEELYQRTLEVIKDHPEGIKLADIGRVLGMSWRRLTASAARLVEEEKVRKEGKEYLPVE